MYFVSATRLKLSSIKHLWRFMVANNAAAKQLIITQGFVTGKELTDKGLTFWTITLWQADADMKTFRNSPAHRKAMQLLPEVCNEASYAHWLQPEPTLPDWKTVRERMISEGIVSKVRHPSPKHATKEFAEVKWTFTELKLKPKK